MKLFVISRTAIDEFRAYIVKAEATRDAVLTEIVDIDMIQSVEPIGTIYNKVDWGNFYKLYKVKNMADFLTMPEYEKLEDFTFSQPTLDDLMKDLDAQQIWIHFYRSDLWN